MERTTIIWFCFFFQICCHYSTNQLVTAVPVTIATAIKIRDHITKRDINSHRQNQDEEFLSRVEQAVNNSFPQLSIEEIKKNLTKNIVKELLESRIIVMQCKPRSENYLASLFLRSNSPSCLRLSLHNTSMESIEESEIDYVVSANDSCRVITHHQFCTSQQPNGLTACPSNTSLHKITPGSQSDVYFPRYMLNVDCYGCSIPYNPSCSPQAPGCFYEEKTVRFRLLKRNGECDSEGYEKWIAGDRLLTVNAGCSCKRGG